MATAFFSHDNREHTLKGLAFVGLFAVTATLIGRVDAVSRLGFSPLIIGIVISMLYGNMLRNNIPQRWMLGILFSTKIILRTAIILYGFRITFQNIVSVGIPGLLESTIMVATTFLLGTFIGRRIFGLDADLAMLTASGSAVCGAAAVLATESVLRSEPHKSAVAVSTVVLFGTISMFVYPAVYHTGALNMGPDVFGIYIGGSVHEVAQVVAAGNAVSDAAASSGIIVKMTRVMMLAPLLLLIGFFISRSRAQVGHPKKMFIPYFVFGFILVAGFNSLDLLPKAGVDIINGMDTFLLTMAMCALGLETNFSKFKAVGIKPLFLAALLFAWLMAGGYVFTKFVSGL